MSQEPWSGHPARLGQSKGEKVGRKAGGLGPTTPDEMLRPCRPPVPTPRAEPLAFGGLAEGGEGDPPLVLMGLVVSSAGKNLETAPARQGERR